MTYTVRAPIKRENSFTYLAVAQLSNQSALEIISNAKGHFRPYRTDEYEKTAFELDEDNAYGNNSLTLFLVKGTVLIPSD